MKIFDGRLVFKHFNYIKIEERVRKDWAGNESKKKKGGKSLNFPFSKPLIKGCCSMINASEKFFFTIKLQFKHPHSINLQDF